MSTVLSDPLAPAVRFDPDELRVARPRAARGANLRAPAPRRRCAARRLRVARLPAVRGPNFWRLAPVIACDLTLGSLEDVPSTDIPGFNERQMSMLPTLREHP